MSVYGVARFFQKGRDSLKTADQLVNSGNSLARMVRQRHNLGIGEFAWTIGSFVVPTIVGAIFSPAPPLAAAATVTAFGITWGLRGTLFKQRLDGYREANRQLKSVSPHRRIVHH